MATKKKGQEEDSSAKDKATRADDPKKGQPREGAKANGAASQPKPRSSVNGAKSAGKEPSREAKTRKKEEESELGEKVKDVRQFLREVAIEFRKISWPGRTQVVRETYSVLFLVTLITLMVLGFDWVLGHMIFGPLEHWARLHGGGIGRG